MHKFLKLMPKRKFQQMNNKPLANQSNKHFKFNNSSGSRSNNNSNDSGFTKFNRHNNPHYFNAFNQIQRLKPLPLPLNSFNYLASINKDVELKSNHIDNVKSVLSNYFSKKFNKSPEYVSDEFSFKNQKVFR